MKKQRSVTFSHHIMYFISETQEWNDYRKSETARIMADKYRFPERIYNINIIVGPILSDRHRERIPYRNGKGNIWSI